MLGVAILAPKQSSDAGALFEGLGAKFSIHASVVDYLAKDVGLWSLEDFLFTFATQLMPSIAVKHRGQHSWGAKAIILAVFIRNDALFAGSLHSAKLALQLTMNLTDSGAQSRSATSIRAVTPVESCRQLASLQLGQINGSLSVPSLTWRLVVV